MTEVTQADREAAIKALNEAERQRSFGGNGTVLSNVCRIIAAHRIAAEREAVARIVAWLRKENGMCDCCARSEGECGCGAWDDYKQWPLERTADAIEAGEWK